jgi:DNA-binding CsgD family transcriptional regulator
MAMHPAPPSGTPSFRRHHPLVGRVPEQTFLREEFTAACAGEGRFVIVSGEAGIGKTTLVQDLVSEAEQQGVTTLAAHCFDMTNIPPYGPWLDLFANLPDTPAMPECPAPFASGTPPRVSDQSALFATVRHFFQDLARGGSSLVLCEDLHWADPTSLELLRHIARHVARWPIMLIATYRVDELTRTQPLYRLLPALVRESDAYRLDLRQLTPEDLRHLVTKLYALPHADESRLVNHLNQRAEGNPFFTTELLRAMEDHGCLRRHDNGWSLDALDDMPLPFFVRQVIEERAARLGDEVRDALAIAAVIGHDVPLQLWGHISGLTDRALLDIIEHASERHLIAASPDGSSVRFVHALTREALYEGITPPRRRLWHEQVAATLMVAANPDPDAVAYHLQRAGDVRAWEWLVRAADRAQSAYAWLTAAERLQSAANLPIPLPNADDLRCRLLYRLARLQRFSFPHEALSCLDAAEELARDLNDPVLAADILFQRGVLLAYINQIQAGLTAIHDASTAAEALPPECAHYFTSSGAWLADSPSEDHSLVVHDSETAFDLSLSLSALQTRRAALHWYGAAAGRAIDTLNDASRFLADTSAAASTHPGIKFAAAFAHHGRAIAHAAMAQPDLARASWEDARDAFQEFHHHALNAFTLLDELQDVASTFSAGDPSYRRRIAAEAEAALARAGGALRPGVSPHLAWLPTFVLDGDWEVADQILRDLPCPGNAFLERVSTSSAATLAWRRGDADTAWSVVERFFPDGAATPPGNHILQQGLFLQRLAVNLALDAGDTTTAKAWLAAHDRWLDWSDCRLGLAEGSVIWARYHTATGDRAQARAAALHALALASQPCQPLVQQKAHHQLGELDAVDGFDGDAEEHFAAAVSLAERCEAPFELALALLSVANWRNDQRNVEDASAAAMRARDLLLSLGESVALHQSAVLIGQIGPSSEQIPITSGNNLTRREREVLHMLAARQTDQEIADALFLGRRTIQTHVTHIFNKLGVTNRREAAREAERRGLV